MSAGRARLAAAIVMAAVGCSRDFGRCDDGVKNGGETDIDCGGARCPRCADGSRCADARDCERLCVQGVCMTAAPAATPDAPAPAALPAVDAGAGRVSVKMTFSLPVELVMDTATTYNGINPDLGRRFWNDWRLVTTRYRQDNGELRFIYANDVAWRAMVSNPGKYPDGAVFAKVGAPSEPDPLFPNSLVPAGATRVQFMVKDSKRYAATDGWGYALYPEKVRQSADPQVVIDACHACHRIAAPLDFVFARPAFVSSATTKKPTATFRDQFVRVEREALGTREHALMHLLPPGSEAGPVHRFQMGLFAGSLNESILPLGQFAARERATFLLLDTTGVYGLAAQPMPPNNECPVPVMYAVQMPPGAQGPGPSGERAWMYCPPTESLTSPRRLDAGR